MCLQEISEIFLVWLVSRPPILKASLGTSPDVQCTVFRIETFNLI